MNSNFEARIIATLDTTRLRQQVNLLSGQYRLRLTQVTVDTRDIGRQIQEAINRYRFTITINGANIDRAFNRLQGNNALTQFAQRIRSELFDGAIDSAISKLQTQFEKLAQTGHSALPEIRNGLTELINLQNAMEQTGDDQRLINLYSVYDHQLKLVKNSLSLVSDEQSRLNATASQFASALDVQKLSTDMAVWLEKNKDAASGYAGQVEQLQARLNEMNAEGRISKTELKNLQTEFKQIQLAAKSAGVGVSSFGKEVLESAKNLAKQYISITQAISALKNMFNAVKEIDAAMIELKKVTDESDASYKSFLKGAGKTAKELGSTIKDIVSSTADFARLGYNFADSQELAKVANIYSVVGDDIANIGEATQSIISTMTAFGVSAENSISIVDKFNEVGNRFAISSGGIGDALTRSASSLAAANNTLDQSIALITAANTVVQNPESVGTAFKTLSMRIRGAKVELEEAGLDAENMAETTATLRDTLLGVAKVDIMKDKDTFKSTYQILDELSQHWQDLTDAEQAAITELVAGKRQGNIMSSLMNNFEIAREALEASEESAGSALAEHERAMQGIEARLNRLTASFEEFSQAFMNTDGVKGVIDLFTNFLSILTKIVQTFGSFPTVIGVAAGALSATKNVGRTKRRPLNMPTIMLFCPIGQFRMIILAIQGLNEAPICGKPGTPRLHFPFGDELES